MLQRRCMSLQISRKVAWVDCDRHESFVAVSACQFSREDNVALELKGSGGQHVVWPTSLCPPTPSPHSPLTPPFHLSTYISTYTTPNNYPIQPPARHMINLHIYSANTSHSSPSLSSLDHPRAYRNQCHRTCASMKRC